MSPLVQELTFAQVDSPLTAETVGSVKEQLSPLLGCPGHVVLDIRGSKLDGVGLSALLSMQRKLELQNRRLFVVATDPEFRALLEAAGASHSLTVFADMEQAVATARQQPPSHALAA
jgi:anti-anti-sigma regulatory factor